MTELNRIIAVPRIAQIAVIAICVFLWGVTIYAIATRGFGPHAAFMLVTGTLATTFIGILVWQLQQYINLERNYVQRNQRINDLLDQTREQQAVEDLIDDYLNAAYHQYNMLIETNETEKAEHLSGYIHTLLEIREGNT